MESRLIFESNKTYLRKVNWIRDPQNADSEWRYIGTDSETKFYLIIELIENLFDGNLLYVSVGRTDSFTAERANILPAILNLLGSQDFQIWNKDFEKVIEFNKIGVLRLGKTSR